MLMGMGIIRHIRKDLFGATQAEFGEIAGVTQATVSRWEDGILAPDLTELDRIRSAAIERGIRWNDRLFFEAPAPTPSEKSAA